MFGNTGKIIYITALPIYELMDKMIAIGIIVNTRIEVEAGSKFNETCQEQSTILIANFTSLINEWNNLLQFSSVSND